MENKAVNVANKIMYHISRENNWNIGDVLIAGERENQFWSICKDYSPRVIVDGKEMSIFQMIDQVSNFEVTQNNITFLYQKLKDVYIKHEDIIKMFDGQLILTFTENRSRHLPRDKQNLYYLTIDFNQKEYNGVTYYKTEMFQSMNPKNVEVIRKQEIGARDKRDHTETEHEISPDMI